jgi:hypothetical protein
MSAECFTAEKSNSRSGRSQDYQDSQRQTQPQAPNPRGVRSRMITKVALSTAVREPNFLVTDNTSKSFMWLSFFF